MNKQLELFLSRCLFCYAANGVLVYSAPLGRYFIGFQRYASFIPRCRDSELLLIIEVTNTGAIACEVQTRLNTTLDRIELRMTEATIPKIEEWLTEANMDGTKPLLPELSELSELEEE